MWGFMGAVLSIATRGQVIVLSRRGVIRWPVSSEDKQ